MSETGIGPFKKGAVIIEGHVQGLANARALGKAGIPVVCVDKGRCILQFSRYCRQKFTCPEYKDESFIPFLIELCEKENLHGWCLIPSNDHAVINISKNKEKLSTYYKIITPGYDTLEKIYSKINLLAIAHECGIPYPRIFNPQKEHIDSFDLRYPVLIKGEFGLNFYKKYKQKAFIVEDNSRLKQLVERFKQGGDEIFIQEIIPEKNGNKAVSFTAFCESGDIKTYWMGKKLREHPVRFGTGTLAESIYNEECLNHSRKLLNVLNYTGVCEIEYMLDPQDSRYKLVEINARTWLWVELAIKSGINYPLYIFNYLNGQPSVYPESYDTGKKWVNIYTDLPFSIKALCSGRLKFKDYLKQNKGEKVVAMWDRTDPLPLLMYGLMMLSYVRER